MAIRFSPAQASLDVEVSKVMAFTVHSGWRVVRWNQSALVNIADRSLGVFQPSALSRPGNLGTAYTGVWTENVASANDAHRPIPFKLLTAASLIYDSGMNQALLVQ